MISGKLTLLLFGALLLFSVVRGDRENDLNNADKRRIIKSMLQSQKDIHKALLKIRAEILNDNSGEEGGHGGDADDDDDDGDDYYGGDGEYSNEEEEEYFREQQKKIREVREQLEGHVKKIASNLISIHEIMEKIERKIDEQIKESQKEENYNLYYKRPRRPSSSYENSSEEQKPSIGASSGGKAPPRPTRPSQPAPAPPIGSPVSSYRRTNKKKPERRSQRGSRAMDFWTQDTQDVVDETI